MIVIHSTGDDRWSHLDNCSNRIRILQSSATLDNEDDEFIQYPVRLEQALMEGSYDRVWQETKSSNVPGEEYGIFTGVSTRLERLSDDPLIDELVLDRHNPRRNRVML